MEISMYLVLCGLWIKDSVELERLLGAGRKNLGVRWKLKTALSATVVAAATEHADVAAQVL